jgi:ketosteroid isomerase-like protein
VEAVMSDEEAIRNLIGRYAHAIDDDDLATVETLLTEDVQLVENGVVLTPRSRLLAMIKAFQEKMQDSEVLADKHLYLNSVIHVDGDRATVLSDAVVVKCDADGWHITAVGRYDDVVVRLDDGWRFSRRVIDFIGRSDPRRDEIKAGAGIPLTPEDDG